MQQRHIGPAVRRLDNLLKRESDKSTVKQQLDNLTGLHGWVIRYIAERQAPVFQRDLEQKFSCRRSTMSNILSLMEKNGLIVREVSKKDARLKELRLTPLALEVHEMMRADIERMEARIKEGIKKEELDIFFSVIEKIEANILREENDG